MKKVPLPLLDARIEARARATQSEHPWWPCRAGCDLCCQSLPHLPTMTKTEWDRLRPAIATLAPEVLGDLKARIERARAAPAPVTCPLLDTENQRCLVYEARPIACRTYGFYTERDAGLHCALIGEAVAAHDAWVMWGNGEAIADDLRAHGPIATLAEWLDRES